MLNGLQFLIEGINKTDKSNWTQKQKRKTASIRHTLSSICFLMTLYFSSYTFLSGVNSRLTLLKKKIIPDFYTKICSSYCDSAVNTSSMLFLWIKMSSRNLHSTDSSLHICCCALQGFLSTRVSLSLHISSKSGQTSCHFGFNNLYCRRYLCCVPLFWGDIFYMAYFVTPFPFCLFCLHLKVNPTDTKD